MDINREVRGMSYVTGPGPLHRTVCIDARLGVEASGFRLVRDIESVTTRPRSQKEKGT